MKKRNWTSLLLIIICVAFSFGCSNKNLVKDTDTSEESLGSKYGFTSFELTMDTKEMKEALKASYDEKRDQTEAVYENKIEDFYLRGDQAMEKLDLIFEELSLTSEIADEDLVKKTSEAFEIIDYKKLALKIKFKGHDEKELQMIK